MTKKCLCCLRWSQIPILLTAFSLAHPAPKLYGQVEAKSAPDNLTFATDTWHISASPYLWLAGIEGNLNVAGHQAAVHQSFGDIVSNFKFGFMGLGEVRRGRIGIMTDLLFLRVGEQKAIVVPLLSFPAQVKVTTTTFTLAPELAYRVYSDQHFAADVLGGMRIYHLGAGLNISAAPLGSASYAGSNNWADALGGARFLFRITPKIGAFLMGDAGGGGSRPIWQIAYGAGYRVLPQATLQLGYRRLYFNRQDGIAFGLDATQQGLLLGTTVRFR